MPPDHQSCQTTTTTTPGKNYFENALQVNIFFFWVSRVENVDATASGGRVEDGEDGLVMVTRVREEPAVDYDRNGDRCWTEEGTL